MPAQVAFDPAITIKELIFHIELGVNPISVGPDDAKALRWALHCVSALSRLKEWHPESRTYIESYLNRNGDELL
jgi:hypothetical protein